MAAVAPSLAPVRAEDLRRIQAQVDQLKERLDFISPMLPLVNFVQDYFQKVECETSVQLMRLQNAQVMPPKPKGYEEEVSNAQLETVKWLHYMTDVIIAQRSPGESGRSVLLSKSEDGEVMGASTSRRSGGLSPSRAKSPTEPSRSRLVIDASIARQTEGTSSVGLGALRRSAVSSVVSNTSALGDVQPQPPLAPVGAASSVSSIDITPLSPVQRAANGDRTRLTVASTSSASEPRPLPRADAVPRATASQSVSILLGGRVPSAEDSGGETPGEQGAGGQGPDGLVLGKGSWATAYRQALGTRRDALRLLCMSGIVTTRELGDDNTVINEEHIDECVSIATEMLQTWPIEMWAQQPNEAKKFFEARLTVLYQKKFGELSQADARR